MGNRKTFKDFVDRVNISNEDYLIGYDEPIPGGEKKFRLADLRNYVKSNDVIELKKDQKLPISNPTNLEIDSILPSVPFLSGKTFHITGDDHIAIQLPNLKNDFDHDLNVTCIMVNMTNHKRVEVRTETGTHSLKARGVVAYESGLSDATTVTFLKKQYDTAVFYYTDGKWYGYGDLDGPSNLNIKDITTNYTFSLEDEDKILHFKHDSDGVMITLPNPQTMRSGTQFFVHNISNNWIEFSVGEGVNFHARAKYLRGKYDDAVVYTDGVDWFATGDLS